jgi:hypothetical protein
VLRREGKETDIDEVSQGLGFSWVCCGILDPDVCLCSQDNEGLKRGTLRELYNLAVL